jgi:hypothetical protein
METLSSVGLIGSRITRWEGIYGIFDRSAARLGPTRTKPPAVDPQRPLSQTGTLAETASPRAEILPYLGKFTIVAPKPRRRGESVGIAARE